MKYSRYSRNLLSIQYIIDFSILVSLSLCFLNIQYVESVGYKYTLQYLIIYHYKVIILFLVSWYFISVNVKLYVGSRFSGIIAILRKNLYQVLLFSIIVFAVSGFKSSDLFSNRLSIYFLVTLFIVTSFVKIILFFTIKIYRSYGGNYRRVVFVDENINTYSFIKLLSKRKDYGLVNCGFFLSSIKDNEKRKKYNFELNKFKSFLLEEKIQIIFYSLNGNFSQQIHDDLVYLVQKLHIEIRFIPSEIYDSYSSLSLEYYDTFPILTFKRFPLDSSLNQLLKRLFDIFFSLFIIIFILSWLFPIIAIAILIDSKGPVLYLQKRVGLRGRIFHCYKFRTMKASKDNDIKATVKGDRRITQLGQILRKTSLDELPQFFNVLLGSMSVVGPRPHMVTQDKYYNDMMLKYSLRHYVKPGITGLAQVKGFRGEIACKEDMQKRVIADVYYVKNWSFLLDVIIIIKTFFKTLGGDKKAF